MFDLDQAISEWRRQMAACGIRIPDFLDELESHLRDDMDQQVRSGLSQEQAFEEAVQRIGESKVLKEEFREVNNKHKNMNKKIIMLVSVSMIVAIFLLMVIQWAVERLLPSGQSHNLAFNTIDVGPHCFSCQ